MAVCHLLDTNICIFIRRGRPPQVRERLAWQRPDSVGRLGCPRQWLGCRYLHLRGQGATRDAEHQRLVGDLFDLIIQGDEPFTPAIKNQFDRARERSKPKGPR